MNEYDIRTVEDFQSVPADRRDVCLREFAVWLRFRDELPKMLGELADRVKLPWSFHWVDDDKGEATIRIGVDGAAPLLEIKGKMGA